MGSVSLEDIKRTIHARASAIDAPPGALPTFGQTEDGARPHVEVDGLVFHYVVVDRGQELLRESFAVLDDLLGRIFQDVTFQMAVDFEVKNRHPDQDCRRQMFAKQLELLNALNPEWAERQRAQLDRVLSEHPFSDSLGGSGI